MDDTITITDLELWTKIGVTEDERTKEQRVLVTVRLPVDAAAVAQDDDVSKGTSYFDVTKAVRALAAMERKTIERLAEDIASAILRNFHPASVTVTVKKFPIAGARNVAIRIHRRKE